MTHAEIITVRILYIAAISLVIFQVLSVNYAVSFLLMVTIITVYILWMLTLYKEVTNRDVMLVCLIVLAAWNVFINAQMAGSDLSFSYIRKLLLFSSTLIFLQTATKLRIEPRLEQMILNANSLLAVFLLIEYLIQGNQAYLINGIVTQYLTFHFTNPNLTGMYLSAIAMLEICRAMCEEKKQLKLFHFILAGGLLYLTYETQSRNVMFSIIFFFGMLIINNFQKGSVHRMNPVIALITILWPAVFAAVYMFIINRPALTGYFSFLVSTGKNIDSRIRIWTNALLYFQMSPVFGSYYQLSNGTGMSQLHNTALDIAASYGIVVFLGVLVYLFKIMTCRNDTGMTKKQFQYISAFSACIIMGMGEAALFSGSLSFFALAGLFMMLTGGSGLQVNSLHKINDNESIKNESSILV